MRSSKTIFSVFVLASVMSVFPLLSMADNDRDDHDRARQALLDGKVLPLRDILDRVSRDFPGEPVEIEFEEDDGIFLYELKLLQSDGAILRLKVGAENGEILRVEGRNIHNKDH